MKRMLWLTPAMILLAVSLLPAQAAPAPKQSVPKKQGEVAAQPTPQQPTVEDFRKLQLSIQNLKKEEAAAIKNAADAQTKERRADAQKQAEGFQTLRQTLEKQQAEQQRQFHQAEERRKADQKRRDTWLAIAVIIVVIVLVVLSPKVYDARARRIREDQRATNPVATIAPIVPKENFTEDRFLIIKDLQRERQEVEEFAKQHGIKNGKVQYVLPLPIEGLSGKAICQITEGSVVKVWLVLPDGTLGEGNGWRYRYRVSTKRTPTTTMH